MAKLTVPILVDMDSIRDYLAQHDIVEVVRCEKCQHWGDPMSTVTSIYCECKKFRRGTTADEYCARGEKK